MAERTLNPYAPPTAAAFSAGSSLRVITSLPWPMRIVFAVSGLALVAMTAYFGLHRAGGGMASLLVSFAAPLVLLIFFTALVAGVPWRERKLRRHPSVMECGAVAGGLSGGWGRFLFGRPEYLLLSRQGIVSLVRGARSVIPSQNIRGVKGGSYLEIQLRNGETQRFEVALPGVWVREISLLRDPALEESRDVDA